VQGAWVEAIGLVCLGLGLSLLKLASRNPRLRTYAYGAFAVTAFSIFVALMRLYWNS
jgi:hypothetical protein